MRPDAFILPAALLNELGAYLVQRPHFEVDDLVEKLRRLPPAPVKPQRARKPKTAHVEPA